MKIPFCKKCGISDSRWHYDEQTCSICDPKIIIPTSDKLIKIAETVANQKEQRKNENIDNWAECLSKDLAKFSD